MTQPVKCDLCGGEEAAPLGNKTVPAIPTSSDPMDFMVDLVCCKGCGLVFQNPLQDQARLQAYYEKMYREEGCRPRDSVERQIARRITYAESFISTSSQASILEVGAADGSTLDLYRKRGLTPLGIEPSEENARLCREKDIAVHQGTYQTFPDRPEEFDFVCSYYVLEHVASPRHFLSFCHRQLAPGGVLFLELPDLSAYHKETTAGDMLFFFEHQYHFTRNTIRLLLAETGFAVASFSDQPTTEFGMALAARKAEAALPLDTGIDPAANYADVMSVITEYRAHVRSDMQALKEKVRHLAADRIRNGMKTVVFGTGSYARLVLDLPEMPADSVACLVDNNHSKWGTTMFGLPVRPPSEIDSSVDLVIVASSFHSEICEQLHAAGISRDRIQVI